MVDLVSEDGAILDAHPGATLESDWLTLAEAAARLGMSLDAMRRRMRRGEYPRRQVRTRHGLTWQVRLEPLDPGASLAPTVAQIVAVEPTVQALLDYLRERDQQRDRELAELRATLAQANADLVEHAAQLAEARDQLRVLQPAPAESAISGESDAVASKSTQTTSAAPKRAWWPPARWFSPTSD
jgi:hypothetical protein